MEASAGIHCFLVWLFIVSYGVSAKLYRFILRLTALISYGCITVLPQTKCLKTIHIYYLRSYGWGVQAQLSWGLFQGFTFLQSSVRCGLSWGSTGKGSTFKLTWRQHIVPCRLLHQRPTSANCCFSCGPLPRPVHNMAAGFKVNKGEFTKMGIRIWCKHVYIIT